MLASATFCACSLSSSTTAEMCIRDRDRDFWKEAAAASRADLHSSCHEKTGLSAEYADYDGKPHTGHKEIFGRHDWYYSDAYRTIAHIAMDHLWFDADPWQIKTAENLQKVYCCLLYTSRCV